MYSELGEYIVKHSLYIDIVIEKRLERTIIRFPLEHLSSCLFSIIILGEYSGDAAAATAVGKNHFA